jgi:hypothetical protein
VLSRLFRRLFLDSLQEAFDAGQLRFSGTLASLSQPQGFTDHLRPARELDWVVHAKAPFAGPQQVLDYVGRYTHRVAIANQRLIDIDDGQVRFRYKDYRTNGPTSQKTMALAATEFIRRFLFHVLPVGFHRIRYYGLLGNRHRRANLAHCRQLLDMKPSEPIPCASTLGDYRDRYEGLTRISLRTCPRCRVGNMLEIDLVIPLQRCSAFLDTS